MTATAKTKPTYKFVGPHIDDLADGRQLVPGETYKLTDEEKAEPHNQRLFQDGLMLTVNDPKERA